MSSGIAARYLKIEWQAEGVARAVEAAIVPLELESHPEGGLVVETTIFNDFHPWLGIRLGSDFENCVPAFVTASGQETALLRIEDPHDGGWWWLQDDGWDAAGKRHLSELHRSPGAYSIHIGDVVLRVDNRLSVFGQADIQAYVDDFRGDLLWMVMNDAADASASGGGRDTAGEFAIALQQLHVASQRVSAKPAVVIREGEARMAVAKVRPKPATFIEYVRNPAARLLIGRVFDESADTAENRYIRHMLTVSINLAEAYASAAALQTEFLDRLAVQEIARAKRNREMDVRVVDPDVFDQQTNETARKLDALVSFRDDSEQGGGRFGRFPVRLSGRYGVGNSYFYSRQHVETGNQNSDVNFRVIVLPRGAFELVLSVHHFCPELTIEGDVISTEEETKNGKLFRQIKFTSIRSIEPQTDVLARKAAKRQRLEENNWIARISDVERRELRREASVGERRAEKALMKGVEASLALARVSRESRGLFKVDNDLAILGIARSSTFPMGMKFVSNPEYAACVSAFKKVTSLFERGGFDLSQLEALNRIGILHASDIYEKWCMLKIFMLLVDDFRFVPAVGWKELLVTSALSRESNVRFELSRDDISLEAILTCQAQTSTGRRPDFVLSITKDGSRVGGLVMDAKFRSTWQSHGPRRMLDELVLAKNYGAALQNSKVFILQPCESTVHPVESPLEWGRHCDYGTKQSHHQGWIQTGVASSGVRSTEHLKRLLVLMFQDAFSEPQKARDDDGNEFWTSPSFCIGCGEQQLPSSVQAAFTKAGRARWRLNCACCGVWTVRTHCYSCKKPLFKNGTMWTYHETLADQVTNVVCPHCGSYFDGDLPPPTNSGASSGA